MFDLGLPNQLAANRYAHASRLCCSNRLVIANKNAHAFHLFHIKTLQYVLLNHALNVPMSLRPRLVTLGRCHDTQERVADVPTPWEDKGYVELPLPSGSAGSPSSTANSGVCGGGTDRYIGNTIVVCLSTLKA